MYMENRLGRNLLECHPSEGNLMGITYHLEMGSMGIAGIAFSKSLMKCLRVINRSLPLVDVFFWYWGMGQFHVHSVHPYSRTIDE